ncbi:MAG: PLP-dependent aminotransferase family protein [Lachnospiraceae bacterium]|nr:PLP-dependent aminotransferase family protein [Lachnospiraceae bacterium]
MNYQIEKGSGRAAYLQLYEKLAGDIVKGVYPCLSRMPSKRTIAEDSGLSVVTVIHALELLTDEGYLEARERSGHYVIYRAEDFQTSGIDRGSAAVHGDRPEISRDNRTGQDYAEMASEGRSAERDPEADRDIWQAEGSIGADQNGRLISGEPVLRETRERPVGILAKTMRRVITVYRERLVEKSPNAGLTILREAIAAYLKRSRDIEVSWEQIVIGSGAEYLYGLTAQFMGPGTTGAVEDPCYEKITEVYSAMGISCRKLKLSEGGIRPEILKKTEAAFLHVTPFNSFPSRITASVSAKHAYLDWAREKKALIVEDNYDSELTVSMKPEASLFSMAEDVPVIYINTFSETISPSLRTGYMVLPENLVDAFREKLGFYSCTVPVFEQYLLYELIRSGEYERLINRIRRRKRNLLKTGKEKEMKADREKR